MIRCEDRKKGSRARKAFRKALCASLATIALSAGIAGGTYAWLIADTEPVVNTFTYGDINITLDETEIGPDGEPVKDPDNNPVRKPEGNDYVMIPGESINKDPLITVKADSEQCWLFVKIEKTGGGIVDGTTYDFDDYMEYTIADGWTELDDGDGSDMTKVYYQISATSTTDQQYWVISGNTVTVKDTVTKEMLNALDSSGTTPDTYPKMTLTAYAVQHSAANDDTKTMTENAAAAWELAKASN